MYIWGKGRAAGRVGSDRLFVGNRGSGRVGSGRVGSKKSDPWTYCERHSHIEVHADYYVVVCDRHRGWIPAHYAL